MTQAQTMERHLRDKIIADPALLLEDQDIMKALVAANEQTMGNNVVDLRAVAMDRLSARLDRLEDTHRSVIAAAYENLAGTNQVHRAVLRLLDASNFEEFLDDLSGSVADTLRVDLVRLVLETQQTEKDSALENTGDVLCIAEPGFCESYITQGRALPLRRVTLRQTHRKSSRIYRDKSEYVRSEACLKLDFGEGRMPGMLVLASEDPHLFTPQHGTDLLVFFASVFERVMRQWLG